MTKTTTSQTMTQRIKKNFPMLNALYHCKKAVDRKNILKTANPELIKALCDCVLNVLRCTVPINSHQKKKLRRKKKVLRSLVDPNKSIISKKKLLVQHGGSPLTLLVPLLAPVINSLIKEIF